MLAHNLYTHLETLRYSKNISHQICKDIHYGWHDECLCEIHRDLLCAGRTKPF